MNGMAPAEIQWKSYSVPIVIGEPAAFPPSDRRHRWALKGRGLWRATYECRACGRRQRVVTVPGRMLQAEKTMRHRLSAQVFA